MLTFTNEFCRLPLLFRRKKIHIPTTCLVRTNKKNTVDRSGAIKHMDVSENSGMPKSSILIGYSFINHPFWGTPIFGNTHMSSVIYFRHNDMQDCVIKLGKWYQTAVAEARGRLFVCFFFAEARGSKCYVIVFFIIIHWISHSYI